MNSQRFRTGALDGPRCDQDLPVDGGVVRGNRDAAEKVMLASCDVVADTRRCGIPAG